MSDLLQTMAASISGMNVQSSRLRMTSENIANADTPGYQRKLVSFEEMALAEGVNGVTTGRVQLDKTAPEKVYQPGHPLADESGYYDSSNVDLMMEIADAREAQRSYEANLNMFNQARQMTTAVLDLLRR